MFAKHVSSLTSAYCHDELSPAESRRVAEHLISCPSCRAEFEEKRERTEKGPAYPPA